MNEYRKNYVDTLVAAVASVVVGGLIGRAVRAVGERSGAFDPYWGSVVGILACLFMLWLMETSHD